MHHQQLLTATPTLLPPLLLVWSPNFWYAEINGNGAIVISLAHSAKICARMRGKGRGRGVSAGCLDTRQSQKLLFALFARQCGQFVSNRWNGMGPRCPLNWLHTQGNSIEGESENIIKRGSDSRSGGIGKGAQLQVTAVSGERWKLILMPKIMLFAHVMDSMETLHKKPPNTMGELCVLTVNVQGAGEIERRRGREGEQEAKDLQVAYLHKPKQTHAHTFCSRYCVYPVTMEMYVK